jgi:hypothetical protein
MTILKEKELKNILNNCATNVSKALEVGGIVPKGSNAGSDPFFGLIYSPIIFLIDLILMNKVDDIKLIEPQEKKEEIPSKEVMPPTEEEKKDEDKQEEQKK